MDSEADIAERDMLPKEKQIVRVRDEITYRDLIDKSSWIAGPWVSEPDDAQWFDEISGYKCWVKRNPLSGNFCGYVGVPKTHNLFGMDYRDRIEGLRDSVQMHENAGVMDILFEAHSGEPDGTVPISILFQSHGGLTFAGHWEGHEEWFFGFDTGHCNDLSPGFARVSPKMFELMKEMGGQYRDLEYMISECRYLASQLLTRE